MRDRKASTEGNEHNPGPNSLQSCVGTAVLQVGITSASAHLHAFYVPEKGMQEWRVPEGLHHHLLPYNTVVNIAIFFHRAYDTICILDQTNCYPIFFFFLSAENYDILGGYSLIQFFSFLHNNYLNH